MPEFLFRLEGLLGAWFLRALRRSLRVEAFSQPPDHYPCVYAFQHRDLLLLAIQRTDSGIAVMSSKSKDGELIARPLARLGFLTVRGSSSSGGAEALRQLIKLAKTNSLAITPDGPKGPAGSVSPGVLQLAYLAKIPIIPVSAQATKQWELNTWDRLRVPKPFSTLKANYGQEIWVKSREEFEIAEASIKSFWAEAQS